MAGLNFSRVNLNRKIQWGLGFSLIILIISSVLSYYSIKEQIVQSKWVDHTNEVIKTLDQILFTIKEAEAGQRGFLVTGDTSYLSYYKGAGAKVYIKFNEVYELTSDNKAQQDNLNNLKPLLEERFKKLDEVVKLFKSKGEVNRYDLEPGRELMNRCRNIILSMKDEETRLLAIRTQEAERFSALTPYVIVFSSLIAILVSAISFYFISRDIGAKERNEVEMLRLNTELEANNNEILHKQAELNRHNYLLNGTGRLNDLLRGERDLVHFGDKLIQFLCEFTKSQAGAFYVHAEDGYFNLSNHYAFEVNSRTPISFKPGDGILGKSAESRLPTIINEIPQGDLTIKTTFVSIEPSSVLVLPFHYQQNTLAVAELVHRGEFDQVDLEFLEGIIQTVSTFLYGINAEIKTNELLLQTQNQAEELEAQQEELRQINEEIRFQRDLLQASEEELRTSEEELQEKNAELEEKTNELEEQYEALRYKNQEIENARDAIQLKMEQFETVSKYKSDFLANMSHELRTPLNSILILAKILKDNRNNTLSEKESQHAGIIEKSGNDLLKLINEILDLARIESGKVNLELADYKIEEFNLDYQFRDMAAEKQINFEVIIEKDLPETIHTDRFRLEQILKNLLSNAFKFTLKGKRIEYKIHKAGSDVKFANKNLKKGEVIGFTVKDEGIGIADDKQNIVFEAFQQADLSTTRKFGGSGLGLTISRDLASLLGGEIQFESKLNFGSTFTLYVPVYLEAAQAIEIERAAIPEETKSEVKKPVIEPIVIEEKITGDKSRILIVEDDFYFCNILVDYAEKKGYSVFSANNGKDGFDLARKHKPDAILLDIQLPDTTGWEVLRKLKNDPQLKKIPVHLMSAYDREGSTDLGQADFIPKPVTLQILDQTLGKIRGKDENSAKRILIVEDNANENEAVKELLGTQELSAESAFSGAEAIKMLTGNQYDCVILDINLPDMTGYQVLENIRKDEKLKTIPVIIYSGKELNEKEEAAYRKYANTIIIKTAYSYTRLLEEVKLFLFSMDKNLSKADSFLKTINKSEVSLKLKKVLIVDDDMRNVYSLTNVLEDQGMEVVVAYDGNQAVEEVKNNPGIQIVLMDIMMPEMDGMEATRLIRADERFKNLPIIAVTAKAMPGDKEKCLAAGVSDYVSKPIDIQKLISLMRVWLYQN